MKKLNTLFSLILFNQFNISAQVTANAGSDLEICIFDTLKFKGSGLPVGDTGYYKWYRLGNNTPVSTSDYYQKKVISALPDTFRLEVSRTKHGVNYVDFDTVVVVVNPLPTFQYGGLSNFCYSDCQYNLTKNLFAIGRAGFDPSEQDSSLVYYKVNKKDWLVKNNDEYVYSFCKYLNNAQIPTNGLRDTICFEYRDSKGCYNKACRSFRINPNPIVLVKNSTYCIKQNQYNLDDLVVQPFVKTGGIGTFRCLSVPNTSSLNKDSIIKTLNTVPVSNYLNLGAPDSLNVGEYIIEYTFKNVITGCQTSDTAIVTIVGVPFLKFKSLPKFCINQKAFDLDTIAYDARTGNTLQGIWTCVEYNGSRDKTVPVVKAALENSVTSNQFRSEYGTGYYSLKFTENGTACASTDSLICTVNGLPIVQIDLDTVCSTNKAVLLNNVQPSGSVGTWSGPGVSGRYFDASISKQLSDFESFNIKYSYTHPLTSCTSSDSQYIVVKTPIWTRIFVDVGLADSTFYMGFYLNPVQFAGIGVKSLVWRFSDHTADSSLNHWEVAEKNTRDTGIYTAYMTISDAFCQSTDSLSVDLNYKDYNTDIHINRYHGLSYYPNPISEMIHLTLLDAGEIAFTDFTGKVIMKLNLESGNHSLDISDLSKGLYILTYVNSVGQTIQYKLIKA